MAKFFSDERLSYFYKRCQSSYQQRKLPSVFTAIHQVQSIDLEREEDFFATAVFKERAVAWTVSINWVIVSADELVSGFLAAMKDGWGRARHHNCMKGLITVERLKLGDDARFWRVESPDLQTEFGKLDKC
jgi:hypothetical protein